MNRHLITRGDFVSPFDEFRREFDRLFDDWALPATRNVRAETELTPACDVEESDDHYLLSVEMPGVKKEDVKLEIADNQVVVSGERRQEEKRKAEGRWYSERHYGKFQRSFTLPPGIDADQVEANYQDGVLRIVIPKAETRKSRQIKITDSSGSKFFGRLIGQPKEKEESSSSKNSKLDVTM